jgi:hypothetical protein
MTNEKTAVRRIRYPVPKSLPRLRRLLESAGYRVQIAVARDDGAPLTETDREDIPALLAAYGAGEAFDELPEGTPKAGPLHVVKG